MGKIKKLIENFVRQNPFESLVLMLFLLLGLFLRLYRIDEYLTFLGDEGRDARIIRDLLHGNLVFIGPQTSIGNMYLGPLYYYLVAPALFFSRLNPVGPAVMVSLISVLTIFLTYLIARSWFGQRVALLSLIYFSISPVAIIYGRSSWNPNPMPLFSLIFVYSIYQSVIKGKFQFLLLSGVSLAFALQMHYLGLILLPFAIFWLGLLFLVIKNKHKYLLDLRISILRSLLVFLALMSPLVLFDLKHSFANFRAVSAFFSDRQTTVNLNPVRSDRFVPVVRQITSDLLLGQNDYLAPTISLVLISMFLVLPFKKSNQLPFWILYTWLFFGVLCLSLYKQHVYAHYFGFLYPAIYIFISLTIVALLESKFFYKLLGLFLLCSTLYYLVKSSPFLFNPNNQLHRTEQAVDSIIAKSDNQSFNFGLIAKQNYDESYRYFFENKKSKFVRGEESITSQLFVICEDSDKCQPEGNPAWQIAIFGPSKIVEEWRIDHLRLYRLVHKK